MFPVRASKPAVLLEDNFRWDYVEGMNRHLFWHTHGGTAADAEFALVAMRQLFDHLKHVLPELQLSGSVLPPEWAAVVTPHLDRGGLDGARDAIAGACEPPALRHALSVYCPDPNCLAVRAARGRLPHALWGISLGGVLSLTYAPGNRYMLWHESLHLLGAADHYDLSTFRTSCGTSTCLMQYGPNEASVGSGPFLCEATLATLRRACG